MINVIEKCKSRRDKVMKNFLKKMIIKPETKKDKVGLAVGMVILVLQIIATVAAVSYLNKLNILPERYYNLLITGFILCAVVTFVLNFIRYINIIGKIFGIAVCVAMVLVCVYEHKAIGMLSSITTDNEYNVDEYMLVTLAESDMSEVKDIAGKKIGIIEANDAQARSNAIKLLKDEAGITELDTKKYKDMSYLVAGLFDKDVDAILYLSAFDDLISEVLDYYAGSVKVISKFEVKTLVDDNPTTGDTTESTSEEETSEEETEPPTENDDLNNYKPVYNPALDPNAPGGGGYIGGDNTVDNASKGPITDRCFNIYVSGIDRYGTLSGRSRSDVNILITVNPMTKQIIMTNTPRDYYVPIPGITTGTWRDKLTHAGLYGVWASAAAIENIYGVQIDYYIRVNFTSFIDIINAIGSVEVYSEYAFTGRGYSFTKGMNTITTGQQGLAFARERYAFASGDRQRGKNHMALIEGIINKLMSPTMITNFTDIVNSVSNCVQTNMTMDEITALAKMQIDDGASWSISTQSVDGTGAYRTNFSSRAHNAYVMLPNQNTINAAKAKINSIMQ